MTRTLKQDLGHFFITSSSSHFFNKTDFEQFLIKNVVNFMFVLFKAGTLQVVKVAIRSSAATFAVGLTLGRAQICMPAAHLSSYRI